MQITLRQQWNDPRLKFAAPKTASDLKYLTFSREEKTNFPIWVPDTFFRNDKVARTHQVTVPNEYARIFKNGDVLVSQRLVHD